MTRWNTRRTPSADASHVNVRARVNAAAASRSRSRLVRQHVGQRWPEVGRRGEHAGDAVDDRATVTADVRGDGRRAAGRAFRQRQPPTLGQRRAGHDPRPAVLVTQRVTAQMARQLDPRRGVVGGDPALELRPQRSLPDDADPQLGHGVAGLERGVEQQSEPLDGRHAGDGDDGRVGRLLAAGAEERVDAVVHGRHAVGAEAELEQLLTRRLRRRDGLGAAVERWRQPSLEEASGAGQRAGHDLVPHWPVYVVEDRHVRPPVPERREPRDAVPHLDETVGRAHLPGQLGGDRPGEDGVAAAAADHAVAVAVGLGREPGGG